jgi:Ser/Thr protein kinase RdoA (MazF antagonist)
MHAELEFLKYLRDKGYPAPEPTPSKEGEEILIRETPWGQYIACAFQSVPGNPLSEDDFTAETAFLYGKSLGTLHSLSARYKPAGEKRRNHTDVFSWISKTLKTLPDEKEAKEELGNLQANFSRFSVEAATYGLIHYDFELDNIFYDERTGTVSVIDFDDSLYHWYAMDIERSLHCLMTEIEKPPSKEIKNRFIAGYESSFPFPDNTWNILHLCRKFADIYSYTRIKRSIHEKWPNETGWVVDLRSKLEEASKKLKADFGKKSESHAAWYC